MTDSELLELAASLIQPLTGKGDREVYDALRAALAAQPAEPVANAPVAWLDEFGNVFPLGAWVRSEVREKWKPLYTEPAANAAQPAPAVVPPFSNAQLDRLYANSPEHHKDATSAAAFKRIVKLAERAHGIAAAGDKP